MSGPDPEFDTNDDYYRHLEARAQNLTTMIRHHIDREDANANIAAMSDLGSVIVHTGSNNYYTAFHNDRVLPKPKHDITMAPDMSAVPILNQHTLSNRQYRDTMPEGMRGVDKLTALIMVSPEYMPLDDDDDNSISIFFQGIIRVGWMYKGHKIMIKGQVPPRMHKLIDESRKASIKPILKSKALLLDLGMSSTEPSAQGNVGGYGHQIAMRARKVSVDPKIREQLFYETVRDVQQKTRLLVEKLRLMMDEDVTKRVLKLKTHESYPNAW